jgi:hypothetical protein
MVPFLVRPGETARVAAGKTPRPALRLDRASEETADMPKLTGGMKVDAGYYWNPKNWEIEVVPDGGGQLAASAGTGYVKLPLLVAIPVAAVVGATFLMSLPLIGFVVFFQGIAKGAGGKAKEIGPGR